MSDQETEVRKGITDLGNFIDECLVELTGRDVGFCLVVIDSEPDTPICYASNCHHQIAGAAMEMVIDEWKQGHTVIPENHLNS